MRGRAQTLAADLYRLTGDPSYEQTLRDVLRRAPHAWFGAVLTASASPLERLTPAQRRVFDGLLQGKSARSNHTRKIFAASDVTSRARLLAQCAQLRIMAETKTASQASSTAAEAKPSARA